MSKLLEAGGVTVKYAVHRGPKTELLFGDAKAWITAIMAELKPLLTLHEPALAV